jgi:hypothetical protein
MHSDTFQSSGHTLHSGHIEAPRKSFFVQFDATAYKNVLCFASGKRWVRVLAETPEGALKIGQFHHGLRGKNFELLSCAPVGKAAIEITDVPLENSSCQHFIGEKSAVMVSSVAPMSLRLSAR